jgi:hypothetical protein
VSDLRDTVRRLAAGARGRTEAEIQSDVRSFLLNARFDLEEHELVDVPLEAQVAGGGRIDVEAGSAVIEVKKSLSSTTVFGSAVEQLGRYVRGRTDERGQRVVGVLTDGELWVLFHLLPSGTLGEVSRLWLRGADDALRLVAWLEPVLATRDAIRPTPKEILARLGSDSPAAQVDLSDLRALYEASRGTPEIQLKRELWARLLLAALGTNFENTDELFITHTYLVIIAELVAHEVMGLSIDRPASEINGLLVGKQFAGRQLYGVVEADFFDWPAAVAGGAHVVAGIARRLSKFEWSDVEHDVLKELYESVIDAPTRHKLGEYYTPDWLAQKMVNERLTDPLQQRLLDPACGSGTFLFWAVRRVLIACDDAGLTNRDALERVVHQVQGVDLHPVAVTLARVTYLLALTPERLAAHRDEIAVPVFLADSLRWEHDETVRMEKDGLTVRTTDQLELFERDLHFPEGVLEQPARFDRLVAALAEKAASRHTAAIPKIGGLLNKHKVDDEQDRAAIELVFIKLCHLHDAGRDHLWSYYIRNLARPLAYLREGNQADVLVGNPPWLAYRSMPVKLQQTYRRLAAERSLWAGRKVATNQDLSDLFVARSVEQYLAAGGTFSFVMPFGVLSRRQFAGFRTGDWSNGRFGARAHLTPADDFARVKPTPFPMPCCVISGVKTQTPRALPANAKVWRGRIPRRDLDWLKTSEHLTAEEENVAAAVDSDASPYRRRFSQGATFIPRVLLTVERVAAGNLGVAAGRVPVRSARSSNEKQPWKHVDALEEVIEERFVRPLHTGATIVAFRERLPRLAIVPWLDGDFLDGEDERIDEFPGLAAWWRRAERLWDANKAPATTLTLREQVDFRGKLTRQFPLARHRVVYSASGQHLAACRIDDRSAVIDKSLYWAPVKSADEGRYLCAVLNSSALAEAVLGLQARGQHNPRHFDMHVFELPFPEFEGSNDVHRRLARLAERAEQVVATLTFDEARQFQAARRDAREALRRDGVTDAMNDAVAELLEPIPDLMDVFSEHTTVTSRRRKTPERVGQTLVSPIDDRRDAERHTRPEGPRQ